MPKTALEDDRRLTSVADWAGETDDEPAPEMPASAYGMAALSPSGYLGTRAEIERELDGMSFAVRTFALKQPDQVMRECAAYSARLTELAVLLHRVESLDRQYTRIRTQQVERWLTELERQFRVASRLVEVARHDIELMR